MPGGRSALMPSASSSKGMYVLKHGNPVSLSCRDVISHSTRSQHSASQRHEVFCDFISFAGADASHLSYNAFGPSETPASFLPEQGKGKWRVSCNPSCLCKTVPRQLLPA